MAEIALTAVISLLREKLISGDLKKLARSEGIDSQLKKWEKQLSLIEALLTDASQKHVADRSVQFWVKDLEDLAYDIDDVLDDLGTEAMRRKLNQEDHASTRTGNLLKLFPNCCTNFSPRNIMYGRQMSSKVDDITNILCELVDRKNDLGLVVNVNVKKSDITEGRLEQTSLVEESRIMGREGDKTALMGKLLGNEECNQNVSVVSIVGMGGVGKTTIAEVLYNDEKVKHHFEVRAWSCVSEELDVSNISKVILQAITGKNEDFANLDLLHVALKEKLSKKKFLLVLDDVWNEDYNKWELLQNPLLVGARGSKIIVTTRSIRVALLMDSVEAYILQVLSAEDALSLFAQQAIGENNFDKHPTFRLLGEGMVKKCGGLPLALKMLGRGLKGNRNGDEWEKLLKSEIWNMQDGIIPALRLSYNNLPPHLKLLFAYCSLFPKDYVFDKNDLVLLWMAEGFLSHSKGNKSMEQLGHQYFEELMSRSFFQHSVNQELGYTIHDLINDLAISVVGKFSFGFDGKMYWLDLNTTFDMCRRFSLVRPGSGSYRLLKELHRAKRLRTLLLMSLGWENEGFVDKFFFELLPEVRFLRVLSVMDSALVHYVSRGGPSITKVPESVGGMKHLRYLNFSYTKITCLPEEVSVLYNLQSLLVRNCDELFSLPRSFAKLINLRHLDISDTPKLNKMPLGIGGLTSLQTLPKVMIEETNGFKISDLKGLSDLQGRLSIMELDKVINPIEAKDANLHQKDGLKVLEMRWSDVFNESRNEMIECEVLEELRPHAKLKSLEILNNKGTRFPSWLGDPSFDQLTELKLYGCRSTHLPTLGDLWSLKKLVIGACHSLTSLTSSPSLSGSRPIQTKSFGFQSLTSLEELMIQDCPSMDYSFPCGVWPPNLNKLCIGRLNKPMSEWGEQNFPNSLVELELYGENSGVVSFAVADDLRNATTPSSSFLLPPSLVSLTLHGFKDVESFSEVLQQLPCLKRLDIESCPKITDLNITSGPSNLTIMVR